LRHGCGIWLSRVSALDDVYVGSLGAEYHAGSVEPHDWPVEIVAQLKSDGDSPPAATARYFELVSAPDGGDRDGGGQGRGSARARSCGDFVLGSLAWHKRFNRGCEEKTVVAHALSVLRRVSLDAIRDHLYS
jgi:hypothetical protein